MKGHSLYSTLVLGSHMQRLMPGRIHSYLSSYFFLSSQIFPSPTPPTHSLTHAFFIPISNQSEKKSEKLALGVGSGIPYPALLSDLGGTRGRPRAGLLKAGGKTATHYCHIFTAAAPAGWPVPASLKVGAGKGQRTTFRLWDGRASNIWGGLVPGWGGGSWVGNWKDGEMWGSG